MASSCPKAAWESPTFHFNSPNQSEDWRTFYTRALDYLEALDIKMEQADNCCKDWKQLKLMFKVKDREALQTLIDNVTITEESVKTPHAALDATRTTIKSEEHFWAHKDELLSNVRQQPGEGIHALSQCICNLVTKWGFPLPKIQEMLKLMVLQHAVWYHEARDWIHQQDKFQLTYQSLLSHCKLLLSRYEQDQKARERGWADLASIIAATTSACSIHADAFTTQSHCNKCNYTHPPNKCPAFGQ